MAFHSTDIIAIKQPVYLLPRQRYDLIITLWLLEFFLWQALVIQHKTVILPEQAFDFIAPFIGERIKVSGKRVMAQLTFNDGTQSHVRLAKIYRLLIKENLGEC